MSPLPAGEPAQAKFCLECGAPFKVRHERGPSAASSANFQRALSDALEQQAATSEILRVISQSPADIQPVFDTIVRSAARLLDAHTALVMRLVGDELHLAALTSTTDAGAEAAEAAVRKNFPTPLALARIPTHVVQTRRAYIVSDVETDPVVGDHIRLTASLRGYRSMLNMPMVRDGRVIGLIVVTRRLPGTFSDDEVTLLQTFADQAVIAIENVRLFNETKEALEQQIATSEILRVISGSPTDVQPVFDAILTNAVQLCGAVYGMIWRWDGEVVHLAGMHNWPGDERDDVRRHFPRRLDAASDPLLDPVLRAGTILEIRDIDQYRSVPDRVRARWQRRGVRSVVIVPMAREASVVGAIGLSHHGVAAFPPNRVELLKSFADQAVIAIENVRLFTELQEKNRALTEAHAQVTAALEQQTATSKILRTIAQAQTDVQPVFDTIVQSAARLCHAANAAVFVSNGNMLYHPANYGSSPGALAAARARYPRPVGMDTTAGMAILTRAVVHVPDIEEPSAVEVVRQTGRALGFRRT